MMAEERAPVAPGPPGEISELPAKGGGESPVDDPVRILLVDDRPDRIAALEATLSDLGRDVVLCKASSGRDALRHLLKEDFAVILLDVHMPGMDGFETAGLIRQRGKSELTPIIFITAFDPTEEHVRRGYSLGAVDYLFAPVQPEALRSKVQVFVDLYRMSARVRRQSEWLRREAERRADRLETRLRALTDRLRVGVFRATPDGRLLEANRACLHLLGLTGPEGEALPEGTRLPGALDLEAIVSAAAGNGTREGPVDLRIGGPDGTERWLAVSATQVRTGEGQTFLDGLVEDVSDRKRAEESLRCAHATLEKQARELERSNADLQRFAYVVSHDLQEPLRMAKTYLDVLERSHGEELDDDARKYVAWTRDGLERMESMIRGLLEFCIIENSRERPRAVAMDALLEKVLSGFRVAIGESGAIVTRDPLPVVRADDIQLGQVLQNLLSNALKFRRPEAPPRVHLSAEPRGAEWVVSVRDEGIGVSPGAESRLFEMFRRLPGSDPYPGHGLGLALCKRILERHGGRIWMEPGPGCGSIFRFTLPGADGAPDDSGKEARKP